MEHQDDQDISPTDADLDPKETLELDDPEALDEEAVEIEPVDDFRLPTPKTSGAGSLSTRDPLHLYLREIGKFPMLKPEEEQELARRVRDLGDQKAAFRLISSHLRLVVKIAMDFQRRWMQNVLDLIQEGNVGLMRAVTKFDPDKGIKFSYYAAYWIKAYILKYIMDNWRMVKIGTTQAQRKLFYNLNKERHRLQTLGFDPSASQLSQALNVTESDIVEMDQRLSGNDLSLDMTLGDDSTSTRLDFLPALTPGIEEILAGDEISHQLDKHIQTIRPKLNEKELDLLDNRILSDSPATLREIGAKYGITRERVRQIEARLLEKLKEHLSRRIEDFSSDWIHKEE
ncbi:putative RNA polymerase, sigma 70 family subunit [Solidesulfovibrio carbinoliphilus subsp. oakridgensis]|uniref:RNA polymerase sigma factor n=1 Tax=Solidesulfovibrio carbinoliphilus subsp. oakridgensis TaxID=694327 RepID=G7Q4K9_9BACT|nr:RNA polymerase factor sigma-32 [Solidesulfovibrio carbinoliphilus]EHJ47232.1 putative RNA polymerase, sigma 70 family subunit [Solidesulfovibrio carbinoliphilus subsp. oakridgensis]